MSGLDKNGIQVKTMAQAGVWLCVAAAVVFLLSAAWVWYTHWQLGRMMGRMGKMLDDAVAGSFKERSYDESMLSSIEAKLADYLAASEVTAQKAKEEKDSVTQLVADISHQTRTPISNLLLYAQLLEERELPYEERCFVQELCRQAQKLDFLVASLVKASRLETGMLVLQPAPGMLSPMLKNVLAQAAPCAAEKRLEIEFAPNHVGAFFDRKWTAEAIYNIVDNAMKYTPEGGKIVVEVLDMELFARIEVRDTGIGIPENETAKVFQRFYRGAALNGQDGLGIGLYLSRQIIAGENGYIKVKSRAGHGSSFFVYLPAATGQMPGHI